LQYLNQYIGNINYPYIKQIYIKDIKKINKKYRRS
jgi:hypothetical protein